MWERYNVATNKDMNSPNEIVLSWSVHLLRRVPRVPNQLMRICVCVSTVTIAAFLLFHNLWLALLPALALLLSVSEFLFPIHYTLTRQTAQAKCGLTLLEIRWQDVRHAYINDEGIKLIPLKLKNSHMEPLRGVFLRFDDRNQEAVSQVVKTLREEVSHA